MNTPAAAVRSRPMRAALARLLAAAALVAACNAALADEIGINVYGLSYHFDRDRARSLGVDNEVNPGLGVRWKFAETGRWQFFADAGVFNDSGKNTAVIAGGGALWHVAAVPGRRGARGHEQRHLQQRADVHRPCRSSRGTSGRPRSTSRFPKIERYNDVATVGLWVTLWPGKW